MGGIPKFEVWDFTVAPTPVVLLRPISPTKSEPRRLTQSQRSDTSNALNPAAAGPPEGMEGGAGRPGSRPLASDLSARGAKNALLGRLRRPPDAWPAWPPCRAGYRRNDFAASAPPCPRACVEGVPGSFPAKSGVGSPRHRRSEGLSAMPGKVSNAALGSCQRGGPRSPPISSPRPAHDSTWRRGSHY